MCLAEHAEVGVGFVDRIPVVPGTPAKGPVILGAGASLSGRVLGADGKPAAGVAVRSFQGHKAMPFVRTVRTRGDGSFTITHLIKGPVHVVASPGEFALAPWERPPGPEVASVTIEKDERRSGVELGLSR